MSDVPCGSCSVCCRDKLVPLIPSDAPRMAFYNYESVSQNGRTLKFLRNLPNGDCSHLGPDGCTIYADRPTVCRHYDCRKQFKIMSRAERRQWKNQEIWDAARERIGTLDADDLAEMELYRGKARDALGTMFWRDSA